MAHATSTRHDRSHTTASEPRPGPNTEPGRPRPNRATTARRLSLVSAVLILAGGYVHFCLYRHGYRFIPKIGVSFLLQAGSSVILAAALLLRGGRMRLAGHSVALAQLARLSAIGLSVGTLGALGVAHTSAGLFQFHEIGLRPAPQTLIAIVVETLAALFLSVAMLEAKASVRTATVDAAVPSAHDRSVRHAA
jgi:hypothetical protein